MGIEDTAAASTPKPRPGRPPQKPATVGVIPGDGWRVHYRDTDRFTPVVAFTVDIGGVLRPVCLGRTGRPYTLRLDDDTASLVPPAAS